MLKVQENSSQSLPVLEYQKDGFHIVFCPSLELIAYSETRVKAFENFDKILLTFCQYKSIDNSSSLGVFIANNAPNKLIASNGLIPNAIDSYSFLKSAENIVVIEFPINLVVNS